jgi:hypothetical protein
MKLCKLSVLSLCVGLTLAAATNTAAGEDVLIADFEGSTYGKWTAEGEAFGAKPAPGSLPEQYDIGGFEGKVRVILDAPNGGVRDPQMHYDGKKILFSYRKDGQPCEASSSSRSMKTICRSNGCRAL